MNDRLETGWLPDTPVDDNLLLQFAHAQAVTNEAWAAGAPSGRVERTDAVALADPGTPVPWTYEGVTLRPIASVDDTLLDVAERFFDADATRPSVLLSPWPTPDLSARGWTRLGHPMLVVRSPAPEPGDGRRAPAPGVELIDVDTSEQLLVAERILVDGYPVPWAAAAPAGTVLTSGLLDSDLRLRLAYVDAEPVALAAGHTASGLRNLCMAATMPAARRRGAWAALVRARIADAPELPAVAYTSDDSRPGFVALGFLPVTRCTLWGRGW